MRCRQYLLSAAPFHRLHYALPAWNLDTWRLEQILMQVPGALLLPACLELGL